ncbi:peptidase C14, caspase domain-containing protein [Ephemerocybe angulata]|uniref:Peptidase C14, caspase domain-containing protein n=1 Tax=Ephemerocybe angulata TaxID=980116 RepID=A0A8H6I178_9AGAR|nr:peptidase C14, caspase domain-containing protein [Tulosesus angulatus]
MDHCHDSAPAKPTLSGADLYNCCDPEVTGEGVEWAYSTCRGTKKALLIGINYIGSDDELKGCINDVLNIRKYITENWGYKESNVTTLTDDPEISKVLPTRANIIEQLKALVKDAKRNDALFFCYSGHGSQVINEDEDEITTEKDGEDQTICPVDYERRGMIVDDLLNEIIVKPLPMGCRLTVLFDCCNSGSALDLLYTYGADGRIEDGANPDDPKKSPADVVYLSACRDDQGAMTDFVDGPPTGALSHCFVDALTKEPEQSYLDVLLNTRRELAGKGYNQVPQLSSSHPIDTSLQFII